MEDLDKEITKLKRRNKILTKRCKKLEAENIRLCEELDLIEAKNSVILTRELNICPECGEDLEEFVKPDDSVLIRCYNFPHCKYKIST